MNKLLRKLATGLLGFAMAAGVGVSIVTSGKAKKVFANSSDGISTSIVFKSGSDSNSEASNLDTDNLVESNTLMSTSDYQFSKVYAGARGAKLGSSKAAGSIKLTLLDACKTNIKTIKFVTARYGSDTGTFTFKAGSDTLKSGQTPGTDYTHTFTSATTVSDLTISTSTKRGYLKSITVTYEASTPPSATIDSWSVTAPSAYTRTDAISLSDWAITPVLSDESTPSSIANYLTVSPALSTDTAGTFPITITYDAENGPYEMSEDVSNVINSSYTVNAIPDTALSFKTASKTIAVNDEVTLSNELATNTGDSPVSFAIKSGSNFVSLSNGVVTGTAIGTAVIRATKGTTLSAELTIEVSNIFTWTHTFSEKLDSYSGEKTLTGRTWAFAPSWHSSDPGVQSVHATKGQQFGTSAKYLDSLTLSSSSFSAYSEIQEINIETSGAASTNAKLSVSVGSVSYECSDATQVSLTDSNTEYSFTGSGSGLITLTWTQTSDKALYIKSISVVYDATEPTQAGLKVSWASDKGSYKNGAAAGSEIDLSTDISIYKTTAGGTPFGDAITSSFSTYVKNSSDKYLSNGSWYDEETAFSTSTDKIAFTNIEPGTYSLYVTTPKEQEGVWTSNSITLTIVAKVASTVTMNSSVSKTTYISYYDVFEAYSGTVNASYNDGGSGSNHTPVIKYFNGDDEINISTIQNSDGTFKVNSDTTLTVKLFDEGDTNGENAFDSYTLTIYPSVLTVVDGNGASAEYESGKTGVTLNPTVTFMYEVGGDIEETSAISNELVNIYIKEKGAQGDGKLFDGTLPTVSDTTEYTITVVLKTDITQKGTYDITVVNATFAVNTQNAKTSYIFGESISKSGLVVTLTYGSASPTVIDAANYDIVDENSNTLSVVKFIGTKTVYVKYLGYTASYTISSTNVGSSTSNIHDPIPGEVVLDSGTSKTYQNSEISTANMGSSSKLKNGSTLTVSNAFTGMSIGKIEISIKYLTATSPVNNHQYTLYCLNSSGERITGYSGTSTTYSGSSSATAVTASISNIAQNSGTVGWQIENSKTGATNAPNAVWSEVTIKYYQYEESESTVFPATPREQALAYSAYFLNLTTGYCTAGVSSSIKTLLATEYNGMVAEAKTAFTSADIVRGYQDSYEDDITQALSRYINMYEEFETGDFLSLGSDVLNKSATTSPLFNIINGQNTNTIAIIVIISMVSVGAIGGYFFIRRKQEN